MCEALGMMAGTQESFQHQLFFIPNKLEERAEALDYSGEGRVPLKPCGHQERDSP